jgi:hypothetical protein
MLATVRQYGGTIIVGARAERPIESCELSPNAFVQIKCDKMDNVARARMQDPSNFYFTFEWYRGPAKSPCFNPNCSRNESFEPIKWSKSVLGGPELICSVCTAAGYPPHDACFCSKRYRYQMT